MSPMGVPLSFTRIVGEEYVKLDALKVSHPAFSLTCVTATFDSELSEVMETVALIGALVKP